MALNKANQFIFKNKNKNSLTKSHYQIGISTRNLLTVVNQPRRQTCNQLRTPIITESNKAAFQDRFYAYAAYRVYLLAWQLAHLGFIRFTCIICVPLLVKFSLFPPAGVYFFQIRLQEAASNVYLFSYRPIQSLGDLIGL